MSVAKFLSKVATQKSGYSFGDPERLTPESLSIVVPIIRKTSRVRQYKVLAECDKGVGLVDTGSINRIRVGNKTKHNVFLRSGTIFRGDTQERALTRSSVVFPGATVELDVRCVHQSKGIVRGQNVTTGGYTPLEMDQQVYKDGYRPGNQSEYWASVKQYAASAARATGKVVLDPNSYNPHDGGGDLRQSLSSPLPSTTPPPAYSDALLRSFDTGYQARGAAGPAGPVGHAGLIGSAGTLGSPDQTISMGAAETDDLSASIDVVASNLDDLLSKVKLHKNQVGLGLVSEKGVQCIELFDATESWQAIHNDAVARVGSDLARKDEEHIFEHKPQHVINAMSAILAQDYKTNVIYEHKPSNGEPPLRITGLTGDRFVGEVVELDKKVIHLTLIRIAA